MTERKTLSPVRINHLRKRRRRKNVPSIEIEIYNNRQHMRCVGTRQQKTGDGINLPDDVDPVLKDEARPHELVAYQARSHNNEVAEAAAKVLYNELLPIIEDIARQDQWQGHLRCEALTSLLIDEFMHPARYRKRGYRRGRMCISALARGMRPMDRKTFRGRWLGRFMACRVILDYWYRSGRHYLEPGN